MSKDMTWGEVKAFIDKTIGDEARVWYLDFSFPTVDEDGTVSIEAFPDTDGMGMVVHG